MEEAMASANHFKPTALEGFGLGVPARRPS